MTSYLSTIDYGTGTGSYGIERFYAKWANNSWKEDKLTTTSATWLDESVTYEKLLRKSLKEVNKNLDKNPLFYNNEDYGFWKETYNTSTTGVTSDNYSYDTWRWEKGSRVVKPVDPAVRMRQIIQSRQAPAIIVQPRALTRPIDVREQRARETLMRMIGLHEYRNYVRRGFITVYGKSGMAYQVFPGGKHTVVWSRGKAVEELCVCLPSGYAPTDSVIMRYLLILNDEQDFRERSNKWRTDVTPKPHLAIQPENKNLVEIFSGLKLAAA